jgi:hypothetical protein
MKKKNQFSEKWWTDGNFNLQAEITRKISVDFMTQNGRQIRFFFS